MSNMTHTLRRVVVVLLVLGAVLLLGAISTDSSPRVDWPWLQEHAHGFYVTKGLLSLVAVVLLIVHMIQAFAESMRLGQRLRYVALLYFAALMAAASTEQVRQHADVNGRNIGGMVGALLVIVAMVISIREAGPSRGLVRQRQQG